MKKLILAFTCLLFASSMGWAKVIYVKKDGSNENSGTSWLDAYETIEYANSQAADDDQIWVMEGVYAPAVQIEVDEDVHFYGGFPNDLSNPQWSDRNWKTNETIVDGGNSIRCFYISSSVSDATIDGFTIRNGFTSGNGAGVFRHFSGSTIANCTFYNNRADSGGAVYSFQGGGPISNCDFFNNTAAYGGALSNNDGGVQISGCNFWNNSASDHGGAISNSEAGVYITNCSFTNNSADSGGAIYNDIYGFVSISACIFAHNTATGNGGAMTTADTSPVIKDCIFSNNTAENGGAMYNRTPRIDDTEVFVTNSIFANNVADEEGGAMYNDPDVFSEIINCTFYGNFAEQVGGAISNHDSNPVITNCILWNDDASSAAEIYNVNDTTIPVVTYSNVDGGYPGIGNINADPVFVDPANDDFHLQSGSPCINAGTSTGAPDDDFEGDVRPQGSGYDMGADEYVYVITIYKIIVPSIMVLLMD